MRTPIKTNRRLGGSIVDLFTKSVAIILLLTAGVKLFSAFQISAFLDEVEILTGMHMRSTLVVVATAEIICAVVLMGEAPYSAKFFVLGGMMASFWVYRAGLWIFEIQKSCPCLGTLAELLPIRQKLLDGIALALLAYISLGSVFVILWQKYLRRPIKLETSRS